MTYTKVSKCNVKTSEKRYGISWILTNLVFYWLYKEIRFAGIKFPSTMDKNGFNLVLFNEDVVVGDVEVEYIRINEIEYSY